MPDQTSSGEYPGERLGLPRQGPGSIAKVGRRAAALIIDLACATIVGYAFFASPDAVPVG